MKVVFTVLWLLSNGDIDRVATGDAFDTMEECLAFKHQYDFVQPAELGSAYISYCAPQP